METSLSIPDELLDATEAFAKRAGKSRNEVMAEALRHYLCLHDPDHLTLSLDRVAESVGSQDDPFLRAAAHQVLDRTDW